MGAHTAGGRTTATGPVVVITGGTRGIGLGLAHELLTRGASVVICGRSQPTVDAAVKELSTAGAGDRVHGMTADVTKRADLQGLWDVAVGRFGTVDFWVNNAGTSAPRRPFAEVPESSIETVLATNLHGVINGTAVALAGMSAQGFGHVWNMEGFGSGGQKANGMAAYGASKRAVTYLTESLVKEQKGQPVSVGFLSPGIVLTDLLEDDYDGQPEALEKAKKIFNILGDRVETVTPFLADGVLNRGKNGARVAWLTTPKAATRFLKAPFRKRDLWAERDQEAARV